MSKYIIKLDETDDYIIDNAQEVFLENNKTFTYTFWENSKKKVNGLYKKSAIDLLYISFAVFYLDRIIKRETSSDAWSRNIEIYMPVLEIEKWNNNKELLEKMLKFLSGDIWTIHFRKRDYNTKEKNVIEKIEEKESNITKVCMFSGGLDSYIGAIDLLEKEKDVYFISHYGGGKGSREYQECLREGLIKEYEISEDNFYSFYAAAKKGVEDTTRTRSLMFFAHAIAIASTNNQIKQLIIPENGLISLNIPLTYSRLGTSSTRTTHPEYIKYLQQLLLNLGLEISIFNPYQFFTKGEMIKNCSNINLLKRNIVNTMSCSHPDSGRMQKETEAKHCGTCLPCVVRRSSIKFGLGIDETEYLNKDFKDSKVAKENLKSYKIGIMNFDEKYASFNITRSGKIEEKFEDYVELYKRGMKELKSLLEDYYG